jgi:hypothetical protein
VILYLVLLFLYLLELLYLLVLLLLLLLCQQLLPHNPKQLHSITRGVHLHEFLSESTTLWEPSGQGSELHSESL